MAAISHGVYAASFLVLCLFLFSLVFGKFLCSTGANMSFNPVLFAELLRKHERKVQSKNVI